MQRNSLSRTAILVTGMALLLGLVAPANLLAATIYYVPAAGGDWSTTGNWNLGRCPAFNDDVEIIADGGAHKGVFYEYTGADGLNSITIDGQGGAYAAIWHLELALDTTNMYIGDDGEGTHWMESSAHLWVDDTLYVGYTDTGPGHFYMATAEPGVGSGLYVGDLLYVGYQCPGDFDHVCGEAQCNRLYIGQNDTGEYTLRDSISGTELTVVNSAVIGNAAEGTFEQLGGTFNHTGGNSLKLGLNPGGVGSYLMKGGQLNAGYISIAFSGNGYFTQSGGTVDVTGNVTLGCSGSSPNQAWYKLNENDGTAELNIGGDLSVGTFTSAKYEQTGGTATIDGDLGIYGGGGTSKVYLGSSAGLLEVNGDVTNHSGYYDQDGGVLSTSNFTNNSSQGFNLDYNADFRATTLNHTAGTLYMWRNAQVRGEQVMPGIYFMCNFTNDSNVQMGNVSYNGGTFTGHMTNNGTFNYTQGDFSGSTLTNYGTVNLNAPFTCNRFVQNAYSFTVTPTAPITANGTGYANAFESNGNLSIQDGASITVVDSPLVSNEPMYAGGTVIGDVVSNAYLLPAIGSATDEFYIDGDFTQSSTGFLRIRLGGNIPITDFDRLRLTGHATLGGTLQVLLINGFVPGLGDSFRVVIYNGGHTDEFDTLSLPTLPNDWQWDVKYLSGMLQLDVVEQQQQFELGDLNCDGSINSLDIDPFVLAMTDPSGYASAHPVCDINNADCNEDGSINSLDIDPFVAILSGG